MVTWKTTSILLVTLLLVAVWEADGHSYEGRMGRRGHRAPVVDFDEVSYDENLKDDLDNLIKYEVDELDEPEEDEIEGMDKLETRLKRDADAEPEDVIQLADEENGQVTHGGRRGHRRRGHRRRGGRRQGGRRGNADGAATDDDDDDDDDATDEEVTSVGGRRGHRGRGNRRRGGRRGHGARNRRPGGHGRGVVGRRQEGNAEEDEGAETETDATETTDNEQEGGRRRGHARRGGRRPHGGRGHRGRGRRPHGGRHHGGRRHHGRRGRPGAQDGENLLRDYSDSNGKFALDLYKEMVKDSDNFAFSPFSVHSAMAMVLLGTAGPAKREIIRSLHIASPIHPGFQTYNDSLDEDDENATLLLANAVYTKPNFSIKRAYSNKLTRFYDASVNRFANENPEEPINSWVAEKTNDMIQDFLSEGEITDDTAMMLLNAVYFKALWNEKFEADMTTLKPFTDNDGGRHDVYMMRKEGHFKVEISESLGITAIRIPYKGDRYSFTVILPDADTDLETVEENLTFEALNTTLRRLAERRTTRISLEVPKFSMDTEAPLKTKLQSLGISEVFAGSPSAFRRMTHHRNLRVSGVKHRCVMEVDEEGTEAAAVTGVQIEVVSLPPTYKLDRPFMFLVRDDETNMNLFMGRYVNPQGENLVSE